MTRKEFNVLFVKLMQVFPSDRVTEATQEVYWDTLGEIPLDIFQKGVEECFTNCKFFPTIYELGVVCFGEEKGGMVTKCDPWRRQQFYQQYVQPQSWRQRMIKVVAQKELGQMLKRITKKD